MKNIDSVNKKSPPRVTISSSPAPQSVNLLNGKTKNRGIKILKRLLTIIVLIIVLLGGALFLRAANLSQKIFVGQKTTFFSKILDVIRGGGDNQKLTGEDLGQINILLLGIGGEGHDGPYLTDTMILAQIRPDLNEITLTSIPRDYLVDLPDGQGQQKINAAFALGMGKDMNWDQAGAEARQVVENISGLKIPYFAVIDFSGFEEAINKVGGVDVTVDRTFTDYQYPDSGTGYLPPQTFEAGPQHMDGATALIFARSRHAAGIEGSDFARSQRQQKIINAFKEKVLTSNLIKDAATLNSLMSTFANHFHTNMSPAQLLRAYSLTSQKNSSGATPQILPLSLDPSTNLICPEILASNGAYVLVPCNSAQDVENFFKNSFSIGKISAEKSVVGLGSSTGDKAAYDTAVRKLTDAGITVYNLSYSKDNLPSTLVYQANPKPGTAEFIANELNGTQVDLPPPGVHVDDTKVDVIVILGANAPVEAAPTPYVRPPAQQASTTTSTNASVATTTNSTTTRTLNTTVKSK